ncbi:MAG: ATP-dependent helicase [Deltaproteobacteria bacterium]|nr:ATP-dependent helicase [Deltaproteobacteria bacterium]
MPAHTTVFLGPPGTGKTTRLVAVVADLQRRGVPLARTAFLTFTVAAAKEAVDRLNLCAAEEEPPPWFCTIHAAAKRILKVLHPAIMDAEQWLEFGHLHGYEFTPGIWSKRGVVEGGSRRMTRHDELRYVYGWGRARGLNLRRCLAICPTVVDRFDAAVFAQRVERFKADRDLVDFHDLLFDVLASGTQLPVTALIIDEAQDLSPLQAQVVEQWAACCEEVYVAGDDDQAIFGFQGGDASWLRRCAEGGHVEVLGQSHRVPHAAHQIAGQIIRSNRTRIPKRYEPTDSPGTVEVMTLDEALGSLDGQQPTLVLARNWLFLRGAAKQLIEGDVPFIGEGTDIWPNPLAKTGLLQALRAATAIVSGTAVAAADLAALSRWLKVPGGSGPGKRTLGVVSPERAGELLGPGRVCQLREHGPAVVAQGLPDREYAYIGRMVAKYGEVPEPCIRLTTIHQAKGREAPTVVVLSDMTRASHDELLDTRHGGNEAENRVAYVAVTRTSDRLVIVRPTTRRYYPYPGLGGSGVQLGRALP